LTYHYSDTIKAEIRLVIENKLKRLAMLTFCLLMTTIILPETILAQVTSITEQQNISFGAFTYTGTAGGSIIVSNLGKRTATGNIILLNSAESGQEAIFKVISTPHSSISSITATGNSVNLASPKGGNMHFTIGTIAVDGINISNPFTSSAIGIDYLHIGGILTIPNGSSIPGMYRGRFMITINY